MYNPLNDTFIDIITGEKLTGLQIAEQRNPDDYRDDWQDSYMHFWSAKELHDILTYQKSMGIAQ